MPALIRHDVKGKKVLLRLSDFITWQHTLTLDHF
jgi:hypothetical protein